MGKIVGQVFADIGDNNGNTVDDRVFQLACRVSAMQDALDDGGSDNITIIVGRVAGKTAANSRGSATAEKIISGTSD